jgi:hypothetical protein
MEYVLGKEEEKHAVSMIMSMFGSHLAKVTLQPKV